MTNAAASTSASANASSDDGSEAVHTALRLIRELLEDLVAEPASVHHDDVVTGLHQVAALLAEPAAA